MKIGEKIEIERLPSGFYAVRQAGQPIMVGGAASTAIRVVGLAFRDEAMELPEIINLEHVHGL